MKKNTGQFKKGHKPWNKNTKGLQVSWNKGRKYSDEHKKKLSNAHLKGGIHKECFICKKIVLISPSRQKYKNNYCSVKCYATWIRKSKFHTGSNNVNWKGGVVELKHKIIYLPEYKAWRCEVYKRDKWTCQNCGSQESNNFNAHHIIPFSFIIESCDINNIEDALNCKLLWDVNNGQTLCIPCHKKTNTYSIKVNKLLDKYKL